MKRFEKGVRYFQCAAKHGSFVPPHKIVVKEGVEASSSTPKKKVGGSSSPLRTPASSAKKSKTPSRVSPERVIRAGKYSIGSRVMVGTRVGHVAFIGKTKFAVGEWAGVVLDKPEGKNNGSVAGVSYFDCEPKHGLFVLRAKLVDLPAPSKLRKPGGTGLPVKKSAKVPASVSRNILSGSKIVLSPSPSPSPSPAPAPAPVAAAASVLADSPSLAAAATAAPEPVAAAPAAASTTMTTAAASAVVDSQR